ncbi:MAG: phosphotransferase [Gammaproteobacteria bacterium]|nr:phosphotransferase [Gammaproteobacteria bacterium]
MAGVKPVPASADASFRRYFRLQTNSESFIAMDAPPPQEDCQPFVRIAGFLEAMQLNAPRVLEADLDQGFLLLSDLGTTQYLVALNDDAAARDLLYGDALLALQRMQLRGSAYQSLLPPYDDALLTFELSLFHDWLCEKYLNLEFSDAEERHWQIVCECLIRNALEQAQVFVHRDYHSRNLMLTDRDNPGILDFQDAVEGPLTYDLVSLLKDCYLRWDAGWVRACALEFFATHDETIRDRVNAETFVREFELMGVQRHLKAAGIFTRLKLRDGKEAYMRDIPLTLSYILEVAPRYEELDFLDRLIRERVLPALEAAG